MFKSYVVILLFNKNYDKVLLVKRNKKPYPNCWNGIGGKIEQNESVIDATIRECQEETNINLKHPKQLLTIRYPQNNPLNSNVELHVMYDIVEETPIKDNEEGHYEWKNIDFVMNINNQEIAGFSNLNQFVKEILDLENIKKFYTK